jgi:uncharacterized membrane protein YkvA (DUF1232 family)
MSRLGQLFSRANTARLATHLLALWKLFKHRETPLAAKCVAVAVIAYAVSPIDLIPDFIPIFGLLDELVVLPLGIALVIRLTPQHLWQQRLAEAEQGADKLPRLIWGAVFVLLVWAAFFALFVWWLLGWVMKGA